MRLHRLAVTAFGPFADPQTVDFDQLSEAGLFLLSGPTGSGKTSVLDAICFALFGQVPGDRDKAKRLRSDHAEATSGPRVVLELTVRGRRLRITRSPEWTRPKKRGTGTTREPAKVLLEELAAGTWHQRSSRIDEAADLLAHLVGLTATQFYQVALLPQGRFETFLKAGATERHQLLERIFDAARFRAVEEWLADHRTRLGRLSGEHEERVRTVLARICEVAETSSPLDADGGVDDDEAVLDRSAARRDEAVAALADARAARATAELAAKRGGVELEHARVRADLQHRYAEAVGRRERLDALAEETGALRNRIAAARRADAVAPSADLADEQARRTSDHRRAATEAALRSAEQLPDSIRTLLTGLPRDPTPDQWPDADLAAAVESTRAECARIAALEPMQHELDDVTATLRHLDADVVEQMQLREQARQAAAELESREARLRAQLAEAAGGARDLAALDHQLEVARTRLEAAAEAHAAGQERTRLADLAREATDRALETRARWLDARQRRLEGIAAELAATLAVSAECPVCGSIDHPRPARPSGATVTPDDEQRADHRHRDAEATRASVDHALRDVESRLAAAEAGSGGLDVQAAARIEIDLQHRRDAALAARDDLNRLTAQLETVEHERSEAADLGAEVGTDLAALQARCAELTRRRSRLHDTLTTELGAQSTVHDRLHGLTSELQTLDRVQRAVEGWQQACVAQAAAYQRLDQALHVQGFADVEEARCASLTPAERADLESLLQHRAFESREVDTVLSDPAVLEAAAEQPPDVPLLHRRLSELEDQRDQAIAAQTTLARRADRLELLHSELDSTLATWQPLRRAHHVAADLAGMCAGSSVDNPHRIRLSSYVLAARLSQVVDAANERLGRMTGGRYLLEHTDSRGVGDRRGGLGLRVRDGWTGESRDPATLSGGETFIASLALALGLADVVAFEAGGVELGTLFVDEGFGSLDADTLDEVMDVLDDLRSGGRVVGLVSHVAELRSRISARLQVTKGRQGSRLAQA